MVTREQATNAYNSGYEARGCGKSDSACPYGKAELHLLCQWMGGFNDKDKEIG